MPVRQTLLVAATLLGTAGIALAVRAVDVQVAEPAWRDRVMLAMTLGAAIAGGVVALLARRAPERAADAGAVAAGLLLAATGLVGLHGTRWGWAGLFADSSFRTQMATRYADSPALADYTYRGLPAYYPPALGWIEGRLAAVTDLAGWEAVKPVQIVVAALVPVAAYLLWRPVAGSLRASAIAALSVVWTAHLQKPDEWLVLVCLVPWWLLAVRDIRAPGVERWSATRLGVVLGLLALVHTYWFLPFGLATLIALGYDAARTIVARRRPSSVPPRTRLPWRRAVVIGGVALAVSAVAWVPALIARLRLPSDDLQMRYVHPDGNVVPIPGPHGIEGYAGLLGLAWIAWNGWCWLRRRPADDLAGGLVLALAGAVATLRLGDLAERVDVGMLAFKSHDAVLLLLLVCGVLGGAELLRLTLARAPAVVATLVPVVLVGAVASQVGKQVANVWATGPPALVAHTTRYPDGTMPSPDLEPLVPILFVDPDDPSVDEISAAWRGLRPDLPLEDAVVATSQVDLLATTPVHPFLATKSIYSHPNGRFEDRVELLEQVASCPDPACAADLLAHNDLDRVDGLILQREGDRLVLPFMVDDFPEATRREEVAFPDELFSGPGFLRRDLGRLVVVALVP